MRQRRRRRRNFPTLMVVLAFLLMSFCLATATLIIAHKANVEYEEWLKEDDEWWKHMEQQRREHEARMANLRW